MNINKLGLAIVAAFSVWCVYGAMKTGRWNDYMLPATLAVLLAGVFVFNLGSESDVEE